MKPGTIAIWRASYVCVPLAISARMSELLPTAKNRPRLTANASAFGMPGIDCIDSCVEHHEVGVGSFGGSRFVRPGYTKDACDGRSGQAHELSAAVALIFHYWSSLRAAKNCIRTRAPLRPHQAATLTSCSPLWLVPAAIL